MYNLENVLREVQGQEPRIKCRGTTQAKVLHVYVQLLSYHERVLGADAQQLSHHDEDIKAVVSQRQREKGLTRRARELKRGGGDVNGENTYSERSCARAWCRGRATEL